MIHVYVILPDRSLQREEQKKFIKNCSQWRLNPRPLDHYSNVLLTVLAWYVLARRFLK